MLACICCFTTRGAIILTYVFNGNFRNWLDNGYVNYFLYYIMLETAPLFLLELIFITAPAHVVLLDEVEKNPKGSRILNSFKGLVSSKNKPGIVSASLNNMSWIDNF